MTSLWYFHVDYLLQIKQPCIFRAFMNEINWGKASRSTKQWISRQQCKDSINRWGRKSSTLILIVNQLLCNFMFKQPIGVRTVRFIFFLFDNLYQFVLNPTEFHVIQGHLCLKIISFPKIRVFSEMQGAWFDWLKISQTTPNLFFLFDTVTQNPENQNLKSTDVSEIPSNVHRSSINPSLSLWLY